MPFPRKLHGLECADLRIAVVSPFVDRQHGTERALAELLERLARDYKCEIHLYSQRVADISLATESSNPSTEAGGIFWHKIPRVPGPHIVQFYFWFHLNRWWRRISGGAFDLVLSPGINCSDADVVIVHALFHRLQELSGEAPKGLAQNAGRLRSAHRKIYYALLVKLENRIYRSPQTALAAVSERTANLLVRYFGRNDVRVTPNGVDSTSFSPVARLQRRAESRKRRKFGDEDFVLLLIGNDWRNKGLAAVLQAMAGLPMKSLRLLVVGDDSQDSFRAVAETLGISSECTWERSSADVLDCYAAADLYLSPSREDSFGLPVAEAMACGLPVITSALAGVSGLIHDGVDGFVLRDPNDVESLSKLIRMLSEHRELCSRVGSAAAAGMREWTWDRHAALVWDLLKDTAKAKKAR
jgi:UDP-glucose:(heptosyl)LPS alpha-1,3-glucosyltransferase